MFEKGQLIVCKPEYSNKYNITNANTICEVLENIIIDGKLLFTLVQPVFDIAKGELIERNNEQAPPPPLEARTLDDFELTSLDEYKDIIEESKRIFFDWKIKTNSVYYSRKVNSLMRSTGYINTNILHGYNYIVYIDARKAVFGFLENGVYGLTIDASRTDRVYQNINNDTSKKEIFAVCKNQEEMTTVLSYIESLNIRYTEITIPDSVMPEGFTTKFLKAYRILDTGCILYFTNLISDEVMIRSAFIAASEYGLTVPLAVQEGLLEANHDKIVNFYNEYAETQWAEIQKQRILNEMDKVTQKMGALTLKTKQNAVKEAEMNYQRASNEAQRLYDEYMRTVREEFYYRHNPVKESEFTNYLQSMINNITGIKVANERRIEICFKTFLGVWTSSDWDTIRKTNTVFSGLPDWAKSLLDDIFYTRKYKVLFEQKFFMDIIGCRCDRATNINEGEMLCGIQNPHIERYNCWDTARSRADRELGKGNIIGAFENILTATASISLRDMTVINNLFNNIKNHYYDDKPYLYNTETNEFITQNQYIDEYAKSGRTWSLTEREDVA